MRKSLTSIRVRFEVEDKDDGTPLTQADKDSHHHIVDSLQRLYPQIPVISEESHKSGMGSCDNEIYWLVDPLDGTKEFIKRNGEFTVNIALMKNNRPIWGVVHAPVKKLTYFGGPGRKSVKVSESGKTAISARAQTELRCILVVSRSHLSEKTRSLFNALEAVGNEIKTISTGSSLKFCMIADGQADCYPRLGLTSEWDTAAAEAVLAGAGGEVIRFQDGKRLDYNKQDILNPEFMACGRLTGETKQTILKWYQKR